MDESVIKLSDMGSFHIGGREVEVTGEDMREYVFTRDGVPVRVDPNGAYQVEQMYVQYFIPAQRRGKFPLLLWHGGSMTGATYETTPDGREGWLQYFIRRGWAVYNSDAMERGRSGWSGYSPAMRGEPIILPKHDMLKRFRIAGPGGSQFPIEAYDQFARQTVPRWTASDEAIIAAYRQLVERTGPCVILAHSQGGPFAYRVAGALPGLVKALITIEPVNGGPIEEAGQLREIPILSVYGDYIDQDKRWPSIVRTTSQFYRAVEEAGGSVDVVHLPELGITGNSHLMMMDRNNGQIADLIQNWLTAKGLYA